MPKALASIVALALALRLVWVTAAASEPHVYSHDTSYYHDMGAHLADGKGFRIDLVTDDGEIRQGMSLSHPPGYPLFLAGIYVVTGPSVPAARLANALLGAALVLPAYLVARRVVSERVSLIGAGLVAFNPTLIFRSSTLFSETLFSLLFVSALAALLWSVRQGRVDLRLIALSGLLVGLGTLTRGQALLLVPVGLVWLLWQRESTANALTAAAVLALLPALIVGAWTLRNLVVTDTLVLIATTSGSNFRIGHAPYSTGRYIEASDLRRDAPADATLLERGIFAQREGWKRGFSYMLSHPVREVSLSARKLFWLWRPSTSTIHDAEGGGASPLGGWNKPLRGVVIVWHVALGLLVFAGFYVWRRSREALLIGLGLTLLWTACHVFFFASPRFHEPMLPLLSITAAAGLLALYDRRSLAR